MCGYYWNALDHLPPFTVQLVNVLLGMLKFLYITYIPDNYTLTNTLIY